ncbi:MAG TPA: hypothetical protein VD907_01100 [Verrucomicrobiae bacterium]|nr:hypothetical protein [Verrucomicrobiae bacterium]
MEKQSAAPDEQAWQMSVTKQLLQMKQALSEPTARGAIIGNHHEGRAAEEIANWLQAESKRGDGGRILRINLGRGAIFSALREITDPESFEKGRYEAAKLPPRDDPTELMVDRVALVSLAATESRVASMVYYLRHQPTGEWVSLRDAGAAMIEPVDFANSPARQEALDVPTGVAEWAPEFTGEFEASFELRSESKAT